MTADSPEEPTLDREHPWPGLVAFTEEARGYFFGRDQEKDELFRRIRREVTTLFFGQSGLGKTSLLQAGLAARLREEGLVPVLVRLGYDPDANSPAEQFRSLFREAMRESAPDSPRLRDDETLWEYLHRRAPDDSPDSAPRPIPVFLIDQFEEAFTLGLGRQEARAGTQQFLTELADLIENRCPADVKARFEQDNSLIEQFSFDRSDHRIVIAMREDYLPQMEMLRARAPSLGGNRFRLTRLSGTQALEAILRPGKGLIEPDVAEEIVRHVARARPDDPFGAIDADSEPELADLEVDPPLLSLFCSELNARRIKAHQDRITSDLLAINKDRILRDFYEQAFRGLPRRLRSFVEDELVTESGQRDNMALEQAEKRLGRGRRMRKALGDLVQRRLLHVEERFDVPRIELIHDLLTSVVVDNRKQRRERRSRVLLGAGLFVIVALAAVFYVVASRQNSSYYRVSAAARACAASPRAQISASLINADERTLAALSGSDGDAALNCLLQVQSNRYSAGDIRGSLILLRKADILFQRRPEYALSHAINYEEMAERERRLDDETAAKHHNRRARALLDGLLPALREDNTESGTLLLDQALGTLASLNFQSAILDPAHKDGFLAAAVRLENVRVLLAEQAAAQSLPDAQNQLATALGSRSWGHVLANNPAAAIADADRAIALDPGQRWILGNKGDALVLQGRIDAAIRIFQSIKNEPGIPPFASLCSNINDDMAWLWMLHLVSQETVKRVEESLDCQALPSPGR